MRKFSSISIALLFAALLIPASGWTQTYNPATSFETGWTSKSNPNGVWSYGYSAGFTNPITLYDTTAQNGINGPNAQFWLSSTVDDRNSPAAEYNDGPAYNDGNVNFLAKEFLLVSGILGQYSDLVFTAPATGTYSVTGKFRGAQYGIGVVVGIVANGSIVFNSTVTAVGQLVPFNLQLTLQAGTTVVFSVGPDGGLQNTGLALTIAPALPKCALTDKLSYNKSTGTVTMNFTIGTPVAATWNGWLSSQSTMQALWSQSQAITEPPAAVTKTQTVPASGVVGILSTLTTPTGGILCSTWQTVNTGKP